MVMDSSSAVFAADGIVFNPQFVMCLILSSVTCIWSYFRLMYSVKTRNMSAGDVFREPSVSCIWWTYVALAAFGFSVGGGGMVLRPLCDLVRHCKHSRMVFTVESYYFCLPFFQCDCLSCLGCRVLQCTVNRATVEMFQFHTVAPAVSSFATE